MATLIVLRHAKSVHEFGMADIERPLGDRGRRDAKTVGKHLRADGLTPDLILCSTATRTRQTLAGLGLGAEPEIRYEPKIYDNDVDTLFELLRGSPDVETLLLIGHNPAAHQLVVDLTESELDRFPTSACAAMSVDVAWADLSAGTGRLTSYWTPKMA